MHLPAAAQFAEALKDRAGDFLNAAIRIEAEANLPMPDVADWYGKPELASSGLGPCGVQHSRSQNAKFEFADAALHAQQQPIIRTTGIIDAIEIDDAGIDETAQLQQMMPVPSVTGEAGGIEAKHSADLASAQPGNELLEARARHGSARGAAQIVVDDLNIAKSPPAGFIDEVVLAALALENGPAPASAWTGAHTRPPCGSGLSAARYQRSSSPISSGSAPAACSRRRARRQIAALRSASVIPLSADRSSDIAS